MKVEKRACAASGGEPPTSPWLLPSRAGVSEEVRPAEGGQSLGGAVTVPGGSSDQEAGDTGGFHRWVVVEATLVPGTLQGDAESTQRGQGNRTVSEEGAPSPSPSDPDDGARGHTAS